VGRQAGEAGGEIAGRHATVAGIVLSLFLALGAGLPPGRGEADPASEAGIETYHAVPRPLPGWTSSAGFVENAGQMPDPEVRFYGESSGFQIAFAGNGILLRTSSVGGPGSGLRLRFVGANPIVPRGQDPLPFPSHFFLGADPAAWRTGLTSYRAVVYPDLYEGIDLVFRQATQGLKYDVLAAPGTDLAAVHIAVEGVRGLRVSEEGELVFPLARGEIRDGAPVATQAGQPVDCGYEVRDSASFGFRCSGFDPTKPLVIDPLLASTFLGGRGSDGGWSLALDPQGNVLVVGITDSPDFPYTENTWADGPAGSTDAFVAKFDPSGRELKWATFLGGEARDVGLSIDADASGNVYVAGHTGSFNFPTTDGAYDRDTHGSSDLYLAKLSPAGDRLLYSTLLGGTESDMNPVLDVDDAGVVHVAGRTQSPDFPVTSGPSPSPGPFFETADAFAAKFDMTTGTLVYSIVLGGERWDQVDGIALDGSGNVYLTGETASANFTTTPGAHDRTLGGSVDAFVVKLDPLGSMVYSTFLGGSGGDFGLGIGLDPDGRAYVTGETESADFPTTTSTYDTTFSGPSDAFVARISPDGSAILSATLLGGIGRESAEDLALDGSGDVYLAGSTVASNFPTTPKAFDRIFGIGADVVDEGDAFVARLTADGAALVYASFLGGRGQDLARRILPTTDGEAFVSGLTVSPEFPTGPRALKPTFNGNADAFVAKMKLEPGDASPSLVAVLDSAGGSVRPENGTTSTVFTFMVRYVDEDNDPVQDGYPTVTIVRDGVEIPGSPFSMEEKDSADADVTDGKTFEIALTLDAASSFYEYFFSAFDVRGNAAANWPFQPFEGPDVSLAPAERDGSSPWSWILVGLSTAAVVAAAAFLVRRKFGRVGPP